MNKATNFLFRYTGGHAVAALAWVPWVPRNPWKFVEGFRNPWILNRLLDKCNKIRHLKYEFIYKIGKMRNILNSFLFQGHIHFSHLKK